MEIFVFVFVFALDQGQSQVVNTTVNTTHLVPVTEEETHFCWSWSFSCKKKVTKYVTKWRTETVRDFFCKHFTSIQDLSYVCPHVR